MTTTLILLLSLIVHHVSFADEAASEILERVKERYDEIDDAEIVFAQDVKFAKTRLEQKSTGKLFLKKENHYRLELDDQIIVTDGTTVWSYSPTSGQVIIDQFQADNRTLTPEKILTGAPDDFSAAVLGEESIEGIECAVLKMTPSNGDASVTSLKLWIDKEEWLIRKVEVVEFSGKTAVYTIKELSTNTGLRSDTFSFTPPEGAEVVDLR